LKIDLRLGSRASALALWQAERVKTLLEQARPGLNCQIVKITTSGDRDHKSALSQSGGVGVFVKELETALQAGEIDLAVHSAKDLPSRLPHGFEITAAPERGPVEDVLVCREKYNIDNLPIGSLIATGSPRRQAFLRVLRPDVKFCGVRGNVDTRLKKLLEGEFDGIVLAKAGIQRLGLDIEFSVIRPPEVFLPAAGQGIIAVETYLPSEILGSIVRKIDNRTVHTCLEAERELLRTLEAGCSSPVGAYCRWSETERQFILDAGIAVEKERNIFRVQVRSGDLLLFGSGEKMGQEAGDKLFEMYY